jgi:hypothetical protein
LFFSPDADLTCPILWRGWVILDKGSFRCVTAINLLHLVARIKLPGTYLLSTPISDASAQEG